VLINPVFFASLLRFSYKGPQTSCEMNHCDENDDEEEKLILPSFNVEDFVD